MRGAGTKGRSRCLDERLRFVARLLEVLVAPTPAQRESDDTSQGTQPMMLPAVLPLTLPGDPPGGST